MLYYSSDLKWEDTKKDNILIDLCYNMINLKRFIKVGLHDMRTEPEKKSFLKKKNDDGIIQFPLENTDIDIFASKYRQFLNTYDPKSITDLSSLLSNIDKFVEFILFLDKVHEYRDTLAVTVETNGDIKELGLYGMKIKIESTVIPKPLKTGSIILDMIDGNSEEDKYVNIYHIDWHKSYNLISGEIEPKFNGLDDKMVFIRLTDAILDRMYSYTMRFFTDMISFNTDYDNRLISENFARGIIYVKK